jgi:hypothetical protein
VRMMLAEGLTGRKALVVLEQNNETEA